jgi:hypothetical protein
LGTIPVFAAAAPGLTTSLATVAASWWRLDPADWPAAPAGKTLQYRARVTGLGLTAGDVLGAVLFDSNAGANLFAEFTGTADGDSTTSAVSAWQTFPSPGKSGYVQIRNQTAARGTCPMACIDVRHG